MKIKVKKMIYISFFASLTTILSQISIIVPLTLIPFNLASISPIIAGEILGGKSAAKSQSIYILLGAFGVPVFANFSSGLGKLLGPTSGFLISFIFMPIVYSLSKKLLKSFGEKTKIALSILSSIFFSYFLGATAFMIYMKISFFESVLLSVLPFVFTDFIKCLLVYKLIFKLKNIKLIEQ